MINNDLAGISISRLHEMDDFLNKTYIESKKLAGLMTTVYRKGELVHSSPMGFKDRDHNTDLDKDTIFRIYSMTKPITSIALMMLYERGLFQLDDPVYKYIPEFKSLEVYVSGKDPDFITKPVDRPMNIHDLLTHQSGFTYDFMQTTEIDFAYEKRKIMRNKNKSLEHFVKELSDLPLQFSPGSRWNYSVSVDVCGYLIEVLSGQTLDQYLSESIFEPLGMADTHFKLPDFKINRFTSNYEFDESSKKLNRVDKYDSGSYSNVTWFGGGGGLVSTTKDYIKFTLALLKNKSYSNVKLVKNKTLDLMTKNHIPHLKYPWGNGIGFGLGFSVVIDETESELKDSNGTFGWSGMAGTIFRVDPKEELILIFMTQRNHPWGDIHKIFNNFAYDSLIR